MEIRDIKPLLSSPIAAELSVIELQEWIRGAMFMAFMLSGLNNSKTTSELSEEIDLYKSQLCQDIKNEFKFKSLRVAEINYCFTCGVRNEYDDKKIGVFGINYKAFYIWLDVYISLEVRISALNSYNQDKNSSTKRLVKHDAEISKSERDVIMRTAINSSYRNYLHNPENEILDFTHSLTRAIYAQQGQKSGEIRDLGRSKYNYLLETKMIDYSENLKSFYERMKKEGKEAVFND